MLLAFLESGAGDKSLLETLAINPWVVGTQVVIFTTTFLVLSRILFARIVSGMTDREAEMKRSHEAIGRDRAEVARMTKEIEAHLAQVEREAYEKTQAILKEALASASASVAQAQAEARAQVERAQAEILREKGEARAKLRDDVTRLTLEVAGRVLETPLDPQTHGAIVRKFVSERA
jgi:F-type H+-transporting ATPase subunit b